MTGQITLRQLLWAALGAILFQALVLAARWSGQGNGLI